MWRLKCCNINNIDESVNDIMSSYPQVKLVNAGGASVSAVALGMMSFSIGYGGPATEAELEEQFLKTVEVALNEGITLFNTASFYGFDGHNEKLLGKAIKKFGRDKFFITSKFGLLRSPADGMPSGFDGSAENARRSLDRTLEYLGVPYVDAYGPARIDPKVPLEDTIRELVKLKESGKVRHLLLSEAEADDIRRAHAIHPITFLESEYSLWSLDLQTNGVLDAIRELNIALLAFSPVGRGFLTGDIKKFEDLPAGDLRRRMPRYQPENFAHNLELVKQLELIAQRKGVTPGQLALAWIRAQGPQFIPLPGTSKPSRVPELARAAFVNLTESEMKEIDAVLAKFTIQGHRHFFPPSAFRELLLKPVPK